MAPPYYCAWVVFMLLLVCPLFPGSAQQGSHTGEQKEDQYSSAIVHLNFNNPSLLESGRSVSDDENGDGSYDTTQQAVDPRNIGGIRIEEEAKKLGSKLRSLSNTEMGVLSMQRIFDSIQFEEVTPDMSEKLDELAKSTESKIEHYLQFLNTMKLTVQNLYSRHNQQPMTHQWDCCSLPTSALSWDADYELYITKRATCDLLPPGAPSNSFNPGRNLTDMFQSNMKYIPSVKWQYFITMAGIHNEYPAHKFSDMAYADCRNMHDSRHRELFVQSVSPGRKNVVVMIDHGNSLSPTQLHAAKAAALHVLDSLSENDRVSVIGLSNTARFAKEDDCLRRHLVALTDEARAYIGAFIKGLEKQPDAPTDHSLGFRQAFSIIKNSLASHGHEDALIIYISRGLLSAITDAKTVLQTIMEGNAELSNRVIINTYAVIDDGKPIMYEKSFLEDIAHQNFSKYTLNVTIPNPIKKGTMTAVNTTRDMSSTVGKFFLAFNRTTPDMPHISLPYKDQVGKGLVVAVSWPCFDDNNLLGVAGFDIHASDLLEAVTYFNKSDKTSYAFVIDSKGYTVMHPHLSRPIMSRSQPLYTDISQFEHYSKFAAIRIKMLEQDSGEQHIEIPRHHGNSSHPNDLPHYVIVRYLWKAIKPKGMRGARPFIVAIKTIQDGLKHRDIKRKSSDTPQRPLVYHRLDLLDRPTVKTCMHLKQLATHDTSTLFLSAISFNSPFLHLSHEETKPVVQNYLAYLSDNTNLVTSPGLRDIRQDVTALSRINDYWLRQFHRSHLNDFFIRRYVATPSGVMRMYPGSLMHKNYDPSKREWYTRAMECPGKVTLTAPYLDIGGAGYIVTISHTVYEGKSAALHAPSDRVVAVMGMDVTLGYFYRLLIDQVPVCEKEHIRCFIMDDRGYLIAHQGLIEPNGRGPLEQQHLTRKEPLVANDILNHKGFVKKQLCNSYTDRTIQRFYHFNTSVDFVLTNLVHGEHCSKYQVTPIRGTNAFLGVVNDTCSMIRAFCPCSMFDRLCLNCHRMEQTECECPCECPLDMDFCTGSLAEEENDNPSCSPHPEETELVKVPEELVQSLPPCYHATCSKHHSKRSCLGVLDCEWCALESDGLTPLIEPFCSTQRVCFAGVLGARTPYHDEVKALRASEAVTAKSTPVGPVAGGIMGCFLVLALGVYCYRHHVHRASHHYIASLPENHMRMNQLDNDLEEADHQEDPNNGHTNIVLATFDNPAASISPYRVNTTYRRPTGGDSDHGYSTMTPHEDSEQASTTCVELLIIGRDRYRPQPQTVLKTTPMLPPPPPSHARRSRSPTPPQTQLPKPATIPEQAALLSTGTAGTGGTVVPGTTIISAETVLPPTAAAHHVLANVQVHMVDSH